MKKLFLFALSLTLFARQDADFKTTVKLVQIYATVFDHSGHAVSGLNRDQFEVRDDGVAQPIKVFEATEKAVSCALLLDTTGSMAEAIPDLRNASRGFIGALREGDSIGVYSFSDHLEELSEIGVDRAAARRAVTRLRANGRTALFDSISQLALQMENRPGKKVIVVLTDGADNASTLNREAAIKRARKAGIPVFAVAEGDALRDNEASSSLHALAEATGGHMYRAGKPKDIERFFLEITEDLQTGYLLAFAPPVEAQSPPWHELQVMVKRGSDNMRVRARTAYASE